MGVTGVGGFFFRSRDPKALATWYRERLGIGAGEHGLWDQQAGPTVFAPFADDSTYFEADRRFMLNLRVSGLDALVAELTKAGVKIVTNPTWNDPQVGRFVRIHDPEGNPIELWEPPANDAAG